MSTTITYENEFNIGITDQQASMLNSYIKVTNVNNKPKIKEEYVNGELLAFIYYQENESIIDIYNLYPNIEHFIIRKIVDTQESYVKEDEWEYLRNEGLKFHSFAIKKISDNKSICEGGYDIQTGNIIPQKTVKLAYNKFGDLAYYYFYNEQGKIDYIEEVDIRGEYLNEFSMDYYNNGLQLFP